MDEHLYIISYDISDPKRWRRIFKLLKGYGEWLQLSVFQCRLSKKHLANLTIQLEELIHHREDHVIIIDVGPIERRRANILSLGKTFTPIERQPIII